jgi:hypothetical protein
MSGTYETYQYHAAGNKTIIVMNRIAYLFNWVIVDINNFVEISHNHLRNLSKLCKVVSFV